MNKCDMTNRNISLSLFIYLLFSTSFDLLPSSPMLYITLLCTQSVFLTLSELLSNIDCLIWLDQCIILRRCTLTCSPLCFINSCFAFNPRNCSWEHLLLLFIQSPLIYLCETRWYTWWCSVLIFFKRLIAFNKWSCSCMHCIYLKLEVCYSKLTLNIHRHVDRYILILSFVQVYIRARILNTDFQSKQSLLTLKTSSVLSF